MKKVFVLMISAVLLALLLVGCSEIMKVSTPTTQTECVNCLSKDLKINTVCIDFEGYNEKDEVGRVSTVYGPVNFYMTSYDPLVVSTVPYITLNIGEYADLPFEGYPIVASPGTVTSVSEYDNIVAFTIFGQYVSRDDEVDDDNGTGASGNTLTDPQDLDQIPLMRHAYAQGLAIVIDVSSVVNLQGLDFATIDLDHDEIWNFLYFDEDNILIHKSSLTGSGQTGDGVAYPIEYNNPVSKVVIFGGMNNGRSDVIGYAIDNVCFSVEEINVPIDIKPTSCPNPINVKSKGVLPVAILGTEDFDVADIDPATVLLEGVSPLRWAWEDVATPFEPYTGKEDCTDCNTEGRDGYTDLTLKFSKQEIIAEFGEVEDGDCLVLTLQGELFGGTPIYGEDVVKILKKGKK